MNGEASEYENEAADPAVEREQVDPLAAAETQIAELKDQLLRALAEAENVRRRGERERAEVAKYAIQNFARDVVSVADNLKRALASVAPGEVAGNTALKALADGVELTEREFLAMLERHGIKRIEPLGQKFDHRYHEAMFEVEDPGQPAGTVVQLLQPGYVLQDRLLRPAMVGVSKGGPRGPGGPEAALETGEAAPKSAPEGVYGEPAAESGPRYDRTT